MPPKSKKRAKFASVYSEVEIKDAFTDEMEGAIEINIQGLKITEGEVDTDCVGTITVSYGNHLVGRIDDILLTPKGGEIMLDYRCYLEICLPDNTFMDALVSTPFLFTLTSHMVELEKPQQSSKKGKGTQKKSQASDPTASKSASEVNSSFFRVIGQGNMDILPLILEGESCDKTVVLEVAGQVDTLYFARSFSENPTLVVSLTDVKRSLESVPLNNIMWITVESIFNPVDTYLPDDAEYTAVFPIPLTETRMHETLDEETDEDPGKLKEDGQAQYGDKKLKERLVSTTEDYSSSSELDSHSIFSKCDTSQNDELQVDFSPGKQTENNTALKSDFIRDEIETSYQSTKMEAAENLCMDGTRKANFSGRKTLPVHNEKNPEDDHRKETLMFDATSRQTVKTYGTGKQSKKFSRTEEERTSVRVSELQGRMSDFNLLEFPQGKYSEEPEYDLRKGWTTLANIIGGPSKHAEQVEPDSRGIFSKFMVDIAKKMDAELTPKIVWNMMRPYWLTKTEQKNMIQKIFRYGVWPLEIVVDGSQKGDADDWTGKRKVGSPGKNHGPKSYIAWLQLAPLLFPGNASIRVAAQLQVFESREAECAWGLKSTFIAKPADTASLRTESNTEFEPRVDKKPHKKGALKRDSTRKPQDVLNPGTSSKLTNADSDSVWSRSSSCEQEGITQVQTQNRIDNKDELRLDSTHISFQNQPLNMTQLEKEHLELKAKYNKLLTASGGKNIKRSSSSSDNADSSEEEKRRMKDIIVSEAEEKELHKLLQTKDALDAWTVLQHKKCLMERHALAAYRKKMKEDMILFEGEKLFNESDQPIYVVVEIKFLKPLIPKKTIEKMKVDIRDVLPDRRREPISCKRRYTTEDFERCLAKLISLIHREYADYTAFTEKFDDRKFYEHLVKSRAHQKISEILREGMTSYVQDVVGTPLDTSHILGPKNKDYIGWLYCRLMDEIHRVVNNFVLDNDLTIPLLNEDTSPNISYEELLIFATEAAEEKDHDRVKFYMSKILSGNGIKDARSWSDYAVIALRLGDYPKAVECLREALSLDIRHKESLLMYAVILTMAGMFDTAELFFYALVEFHPSFSEGWITFHTFYLLVEKNVGADAALIYGTKCDKDLKMKQSYKPPQLAWDNSWLGDSKSYYLKTAIYLLSFNLYEMAEVCLAQELEMTGEKSEIFIYYLAVCHHIQGRYQDSCSHLSRALSGGLAIDADARLWIILGHNKWEMGEKKEAIRLYMQAFSCEEPPENPHMTYIRGGYYFLEMEKASLAHQMFLRAVKNVGTPMGWLGLGIALYMLGDLDEAELALKEANTLDNRLAVAWAYLALICLNRNKLDQYEQCIHEANRHGLNNETLKKKLESYLNQITI